MSCNLCNKKRKTRTVGVAVCSTGYEIKICSSCIKNKSIEDLIKVTEDAMFDDMCEGVKLYVSPST